MPPRQARMKLPPAAMQVPTRLRREQKHPPQLKKLQLLLHLPKKALLSCAAWPLRRGPWPTSSNEDMEVMGGSDHTCRGQRDNTRRAAGQNQGRKPRAGSAELRRTAAAA